MAKSARATLTLDELTATKPGAAPPARRQGNKATNLRRGQTLRLDLDTWKSLKKLAVDEETTSHSLLIEALNMLFRDRGLPPIG